METKIKKIIVALTISILLMSFVGCGKLFTKSKAITINSVPDGALVFVDGKDAGKTPLTYTLSYGDHTITLTEEGYKNVEQKLTVDENTPATLTFTLPEETFTIKIDVDKQLVLEVVLDGKDTGKIASATLENVTKGKYEIQLISLGVDKKLGYSLIKTIDLSRDIILTEDDFSHEPEQFSLGRLFGPVTFDNLPVIRCCSAATTYSGIYYGDTVTISGYTPEESFDFVFPSGKKIHFDAILGSCEDCINTFSKEVTFDEIGGYKIMGEEPTPLVTFSVFYKATPILSTVMIGEIFGVSKEGMGDLLSRAVAVPAGGETTVKLLIEDGKGNVVRNKPIGKYNLSTDGNGFVTFKVKGEFDTSFGTLYVNGKTAYVMLYGNLLGWVYTTEEVVSIKDAKIIGDDVYLPSSELGDLVRGNPKTKLIDSKVWVAVNTFKDAPDSYSPVGVKIFSDRIEFYKLCKMVP